MSKMRPFGFLKAAMVMILVTAACLPFAQAQTIDGSAAHPFPIRTAHQLTTLAECVNTGSEFYYNPADSVYYPNTGAGYVTIPAEASNMYFKLVADITLNDGNVAASDGVLSTGWTAWPVLGSSNTHPFDGILDGDFHTVSGVFVSQDAPYAGFIGVTSNHTQILNLGIVNSYISGDAPTGGLIGAALQTVVDKCFFSGTVVGGGGSSATARTIVGGLIGEASNATSITHCSTNAMVSGKTQVGGLIGRTLGAGDACTITNCYSSSAVYGEYAYTGGAIGEDRNSTVISDLYYDNQMIYLPTGVSQDAAARKGNGMATVAMTNGTWHPGGFDAYGGIYPIVSGFDMAANSAIYFAAVPIFLPEGATLSNLSGVSSITLGGSSENVDWTLTERVGNVSLLTGSYELTILGQSYVVLQGEMAGNTRSFVFRFDKAPLIGTATNPFTIDNLAELTAFRNGINTGAEFSFKHFMVPAFGVNTCFMQTADIDMSTEGNWTSIGSTSEVPFKGTYDGRNHAVIGWKDDGNLASAFFAYTDGATIKNLTVRNVRSANRASLIYSMNGGTVDNCHAEGSSTVKGGLVYQTAVADNTAYIKNSTNRNSFSAVGHIGGILCRSGNTLTIIDSCHNYGNITSSAYESQMRNVGGIIGGKTRNTTGSFRVSHSSNHGAIKGGNDTYSYAAGISGSGGTITYCWNTGKVSGEYRNAGISVSATSISYCYNLGDVVHLRSDDGGWAYGISSTTPSYCFNAGNIEDQCVNNCYAISGNGATHCFNVGDVTARYGTVFAMVNNSDSKRYSLGRLSGRGVTVGGAYIDTTRVPLYRTITNANTNKSKTSSMIGTGLQSYLGTDNWVYADSVYPRIKGLHDLTISKVLSLPIFFGNAQDNVDNVTTNFTVRKDWGIEWVIEGTSGATISDSSAHLQKVTLPAVRTNGDIILAAKYADSVYYRIRLVMAVTPPTEALTIDNLAELKDFRAGINSGSAFTYKGKAVPAGGRGTTFKLTTDITLDEANWTNIGSASSKPFRGTFDGQNHTISGLKQTNYITAGFFMYIEGGTVENLNLTDVNIVDCTSGGSICAFLSNGTLSNCTAQGTIKGGYLAGSNAIGYVGGLVAATSQFNRIHACKSEVKLSSTQYTYVGGIVGQANSTSTVIDSCENGGSISGARYMGGITAIQGVVRKCVNYGTITTGSAASNVAGITALECNIYGCVNSGNINVATLSSAECDVAGIGMGTKVQNSYNVGTIKGSNARNVAGIYVGTQTCQNNYNAGQVTGTGTLGAIKVGNTNCTNCYYDTLMCTAGDTHAGALPKNTTQMCGTNLALGDGFVYEAGMYPRISGIENTPASLATASPVFLTHNEKITLVNHDFTMGGVDNHSVVWSDVDGGNTLQFIDGDSAHINTPGVATLGAAHSGVVYKKIPLKFKMDAFIIKNATELAHFRDGINSAAVFFYNAADSTYHLTPDAPTYVTVPVRGNGATFRVDNDIDLGGVVWTPIGNTTSIKYFQGIFDGDNHTISNFTIYNQQYSGLFGLVYEATIKNLTIERAKNTSLTQYYVAALAGWAERSTIENVEVAHCNVKTSKDYIGAVSGQFSGVQISNVNVHHDTIQGDNRVGGIVGEFRNQKIADAYVSHCEVKAVTSRAGGVAGVFSQSNATMAMNRIYVDTTNVSGGNYVGGILGTHGYNYGGTFNYAYVRGGTVTGTNYVGGISGTASGLWLNYASNSSRVKGNKYVGGISGDWDYAVFQKNTNTGDVEGAEYVGGLIGAVQEHCQSNGNISASVNAGKVKGISKVGGITGSVLHTTDANGGAIQNCTNLGDVEGEEMVGGIIGKSQGENRGNANAGRITGIRYVGGIVGHQSQYEGFSKALRRCYSCGQVYGEEYVGNVAGYSEAGTITYCYYDKQMSSRFKGLGSLNDDATDVAEGKLTREMLNTGIQTGLSTTYFTFTSGLYPRPKAITDSIGAIVGATPVVLGDTVTAYTIPGEAGYTITPTTANSVAWSIAEGSAFYMVVPTFKAQQAGMTVLAASRSGFAKNLDFVVGVSSDMPIIIKDYDQLVEFTELINSGVAFSYNTEDSTFATAAAAGTGITWVPVAAGGEGFFFKLDFDPTFCAGAEWPGRIGTTAAPFKGDFNGNNHTITNLSNATVHTDTCGFFGYNAGTIHNLTLSNTNMTTGSHNVVAALCGYNSGKIDTCFVKNGQVKGVHYVAAIAAVNTGYVTACYSSATVNGTDNVAGICAVNTNSIANSFNMGDVAATATHAGGIAGFNSGSLTNTYNVGNIAATDYAGGLVGQSTSTNLATSYNAGQVKSAGSNAGGLVGNISGSNVTGITSIAYDDAMCSLSGSFQGGNSYNTVKTPTQNMVGNALQGTLGTSDWVYTANLYPRLRGLDTLNASHLSVTPVFLTPGENVQNVTHDFTVSTNNSTVTWTQQGSDALEMNVPNISLDHCGTPTLQATRGDEHKNVEMLINFTGAVVQRDTTCGEPYLWDVSGLTYTTTNTAVVSRTVDGCPYTYTLHVVIPAELHVEATSTPELCVDANDGTATAAVTGGMGSSYTYEWTDLDSTRATPLPTTATINNLAPEHRYRVIVTDAVNTKHCTARDSVEVLAAVPLVASIDSVSAGCYGSVDGMFEVSFSGGKAPYVLSWTGASSGSRNLADPQVRYTVTALNTGNHTVTVRDDNNCTVTLSANLEQDDRLYTVTAFDTTKLYDGVPVNAARYTLTYGTHTHAKVASGSSITLDNGDVLTATVSRGNLTDAGTYSNQVSSVVVMRGSEDVTCHYNISSVNKSVVITKRTVTVTSADSSHFYNSSAPHALTNHRVIVTGDGFTSADAALITYTWYGSQTDGGVSENSFDINWNGVNSDNYTFNKVYGTLTVIKNGMLIVRAKNMNRTYDGTSSTFNSDRNSPNVGYTVMAYYVRNAGTPEADTVYGLGPEYHVEVRMNDSTEIVMKDADTVQWRVMGIHAYYNDTEVTTSFERIDTIHGVLQINPVEITMISEGDTSVYDGTTHTRPDVTVVGSFVGEEVTGTITATGSIINVGEVLNAITYTPGTGYKAQNYNITKTEGTLKVTARPLNIEGVNVYVDYDGLPHTTTDFTYGNLVSGHVASGVTYIASGTAINEYEGVFGGTLVVKNADSNVVTTNYAPDYVAGKLYIRSPEKELKVTSATVSEMYNGQPHTAHSYTVTYGYQPVASVDDNLHFKLPTGDTVVVIPSAAASQTNVGSKRNDFDFAITPAANSGIYTILARDTGVINVTPREVILRSLSLEQTYNATPIIYDTAVAVGNGFVEGEGATYTFSNPHTWTNVGTYRNDFDYSLNAGTDPDNYTFRKDTGLLVINKKELTVTALDVTRPYGDPNVFRDTITGFEGLDNVSVVTGAVSYECLGTQFSNIGEYVITPVIDGLSADNYTFASANGTLTIVRRVLTVNVPSVTTQYDGTTHNQSTNPVNESAITYTNLAGGDEVDHVTMSYSRLDGGEQPMTCSSITIIHGASTVVTSNYNVQVSDTSKLIVTKRALTVKPKDTTRVYNGQALVAEEYVVTSGSVVAGDAISDVVYGGTQTAVGTSASTLTQLRVVRGTTPVGDVCYTITREPGTLTVTPKEVTVTADNNTKVYGAADPSPITDTTLTGLVAGESASLITCTLSREAGEAVGHYVITPSGATTQGNYSVSYVNGDFEITKAALTVKVDAKTKIYGDDDPTFTATITGLQNGDNEAAIRTALNLQFNRATGENVGKYVITASGNTLDNYNVTYIPDTLNITKANLTVKADNKSKTFGVADPTLTATVTGMKNGDTEDAVKALLGLTISRAEGEDVGTYTITVTGPDQIANYNVTTYTNGTFTINKAELTIAINANKNYDGTALATAYNQSGAVTVTGLATGDLLTAGEVTTAAGQVGTYTYPGTSSITTAFATTKGISNYEVTVTATQVINRSTDGTLTCPVASACTKMYDGTALQPVATASVGDGTAVKIEYKPAGGSWSETAPSITNVADGPVVVDVRATNPNYDTMTCTYTLTITPRTIVVTAADKEFTYDGAAHVWHEVASYGTYGLIGTDAMSFTFSDASTITTVDQSPVANTITGHTFTTGDYRNYSVTTPYTDGSLTMVYGPQVDLTITARDTAWVFDATTHTFHSFTVQRGTEPAVTVPVSAGGEYTFANGDKLTVTFDPNSKITDNVTAGVANTITNYTLYHGTVDVHGAYNVTLEEGLLRIVPDTITITAKDSNFIYDGTVKTQPNYTVTGLVGGASVTAVTSGSIQYVSDGTVDNVVVSHSIMGGNTNNYFVKYAKGQLTMSYESPQPAVKITAKSGSWTYDGTSHSKDSCTVEFGSNTYQVGPDGNVTLAHGDVLHVDVTGSITNQGSVANVVSDSWTITNNGVNVASAYSVTKENGTLTVTKLGGVVVEITGNHSAATYDGAEHTATGYEVTAISNPLFTVADIVFSGTASAARTNAGTTNMNLTASMFSTNNDNFDASDVTFSITDGYITIDEKEVTITAADSVFTYDGSVKTQPRYTVTGLVGSDAISGVSTTGSIQYPTQGNVTNNVDTSAYSFTTGLRSNYDITLVPGSLRMEYGTPVTLEITSAGDTWQYDGTAHTKNGFTYRINSADHTNATNTATIEGSNGDVITITLGTSVTNVTAGTPNNIVSYTIMNGTVDVRSRYNVMLHTNNLVVTPKPATITAASHTWTYDGNAHTDANYTVAGLISPDTLTATVTGSITYPGTQANNVTSFSMTTGQATNYNFSTVAGELKVEVGTPIALTITPASASKIYDGTPLTADSYTLAYGGNSYTVGADGYYTFPNGDKLYVDIQGSKTHVTDVATNHVEGTPVVMNGTTDVSAAYTINTTATGTLTITKREVTLTSASASKTYDDTPIYQDGVTNVVTAVGFVGTDATGVTYSGWNTTFKGPGVTQNTFTASGISDDYQPVLIPGTLTVNEPSAVTLTITGNNATYTYDGTEHTAHGYTWVSSNPALYGASSFRYKTDAAYINDSIVTATVAGTHTMALSASDFENLNPAFTVNFVVTPGTLTITPKTTPIVITAASDSKVYDGSALTNNGFTYTDGVLVSGDVLTADIHGTITNAGQVANQVGTYHVMRSGVDVTSCYTFGNTIDGTLTVTKRPVTLTSANGSKVYDGTALTNNTVTPSEGTNVGFVTGQGATYNVTGTRTDVGTSPNTFTYTLNSGTLADNYTISTVEGTLEVSPKTDVVVTITEHSNTITYNGNQQTVTGYDFAANSTLYQQTYFTFDGSASVSGTNVGTYPMTLTASQFTNTNPNFTNVTFNIVDGSLVINPVTDAVAVTITGNNLTRMYDGNEYTVSGYTWSANNALYTNSCFSTTNAASISRTEVGTTNMGLTGTFSNTSSNFTNVNFTVTDGYVTIQPNNTAMTLTCPTNTTHVYDGNAFTGDAATVTGATGTTTIEYSLDNSTWSTTQPSLTNVDAKTVYVRATNSNYSPATCQYNLSVTPAPVVVTAATRQFTYNGSAQSDATYTVTGLTTADQAAFTATVVGSITYPSEGSVANTVTGHSFGAGFSSESNYTITDVAGALTMVYGTATDLAITTGSYEAAYDGATHTVSTYTATEGTLAAQNSNAANQVELSNGDVLTVYFNGVGVTHVSDGTLSNTIDHYTIMNNGHDVSSNYHVSTTNGTLKVTAKAITVTGNDHEFTYTGYEQTWPYYTVTGLVAPDTLTVTMTGSITYPTETVNNVPSAPYNFFRGSSSDYTVSFANGTLTMQWPAVTDVTVKAVADTMYYDGTALSNGAYTVTVGSETVNVPAGGSYTFANGDVLTAAISGSVTHVAQSSATANQVGTVTIMNGTQDVSSAYHVTPVNNALVIKKRPVTLTSATASKTYDTHPLTNHLVTIGGMGFATGEDTLSCNVTGTITIPGTAENFFTYELTTATNANDYEITKVYGTLTVNAAGVVTVEITENSDSYVYNGTERTVTGYTVTSISDPNYDETMFTFSGTASVSGTTVGTYNMNLQPSDFANNSGNSFTVNFVIVDGTLEITPITTPIVITAKDSTKVYDGDALTQSGFTYTGTLAAGDVLHTTNAGSITHVGIATNSIATYWVTNSADQDVTDCYTFGSSINGQLEINTRPVTLTSASDSKVYDGTPLTNTTVTPSTGTNVGFVGTEGATYNVTGSITNVGTADNMFTYSLNSNTRATDYNISVVYGTLEVTAKDGITVNITGNHDSQVYDGTAKTVMGYTVDAGTWSSYYSASDVTCDTTATASQTVVGTKNMGLAARHFHNTNPNFTNVNFVVTDGYMTITPITDPITITAASDSKMYDGTALTNNGFTYTGTLATGDVLEAVVEGTVTHVSEGPVNNVVTSYKVMRSGVDVTDNYTFNTSVNGTLTITKRDVTLTSGTATRNFDGTALKAETVTTSGSGFVSGEEPTGYTNFASQLHYGSTDNTFTYTLPAGVQATDYAIDTVKGTLTVNKADLMLTSATHSFLYDGTVHSDNTYSLMLNGTTVSDIAAGAYTLTTGDVLNVAFPTTSSILRPSQTPTANAFTYSFTSGDANDYTVTTLNGMLSMTISTEQMPLTITTGSQTWTYDGQSHSYKAYTVTENWGGTPNTINVAESANGECTLSTGDRLYVNIGGSIENCTYNPRDNFINNITITRDGEDVSSAYEISQVLGELRINQRPLLITGDTAAFTYDGSVHQSTTCHIYGLVTGETVLVQATGSIQFPSQSPAANPVGSYTFTHGSAANYSVTTVPGELTMTFDPTPIVLKANTTAWNYDGNAHSDARYTLTINGSTPVTYSNVAAGEYTFPNGDVMTVTVTGSVTDYDASYSNNNVIAITSIKHDGVDVSGNYTPTLTAGTLSINRIPATVTITGNSSTVVYNGAEQEVNGYTVSISEPLYTTTDFTFAGSTDHAARTDIGTTNMTMVPGNFTNTNANFNPVTFNVTNGSITITPITDPITITAASDSKVYDATALTNSTYTYTDGVLVGTDVLTAVVEGTITNVGTENNVVTSYKVMRGSTDVTTNYTFATSVNGTLEVTVRPLTITANNYSVMYDGEAHTYAENDPILTVEAAGTNTGLLAVHHLADTTMTGAGTAAGTYPIVITAAVIKDGSDNDVTANYNITFEDGTLTITKRTGVVVTIQEHGKEVDYNATDQRVTGYSVASIVDPVSLYSTSDFSFIGVAADTIAHGTGSATALTIYDMNLRPEHFQNDNANYEGVTFDILDSALYIYPELKASGVTVDITCNLNNGGTHNDGSATITVTGGRPKHDGMYGFTFDGGASADFASPHTFENLTSGPHTVVVTDSLGYTQTVSFTINEPEELTAIITVPTALCPNQGSYAVSVEAAHGTPDYSYNWSGATNVNATSTSVVQTATSDCGTNYVVNVTVTDSKTCTVEATANFTVVDNEYPTFTKPNDTTICRVAGEIVAPISVTGDVTDEADNCTMTLDATWRDLDTLPADNSGDRIIRREWTLTDNCDNTTTKIQNITVRPSILTAGNVEFTCPDTTVTLKYGVCDTLIQLNRVLTNNMTGMTLTLDSTGTVAGNRYTVDNSPYTVTWRVTDECGDYVEFTQTVTVKYAPCGGDYWVADGDGIMYPTEQVGCNCWIARNLRSTHYTDHTAVTPEGMQFPGTEEHPLDTLYGKLYTYQAATRIAPASTPVMPGRPTRATRAGDPAQVQGICPDGWHIPDDGDFADLQAHYEGMQLLSSNENTWIIPGTNESGFSLEPAGEFNAETGYFENLRVKTYLWSYTPGSTIYHACEFGANCGFFEMVPSSANSAYSVRCVHDAE